MGRLTLHVLLSFAQFEREVTAERIRDKIAASKKKGMWMGGPVPLGYDANDRRLVATRIEANTVNQIFRLYVELGTVRRLKHGTPARPCSWFLSLQCDRTCARCAAADQGAASPEGAQRSAGNARSCRVRRGSGKPGGGAT